MAVLDRNKQLTSGFVFQNAFLFYKRMKQFYNKKKIIYMIRFTEYFKINVYPHKRKITGKRVFLYSGKAMLV